MRGLESFIQIQHVHVVFESFSSLVYSHGLIHFHSLCKIQANAHIAEWVFIEAFLHTDDCYMQHNSVLHKHGFVALSTLKWIRYAHINGLKINTAFYFIYLTEIVTLNLHAEKCISLDHDTSTVSARTLFLTISSI